MLACTSLCARVIRPVIHLAALLWSPSMCQALFEAVAKPQLGFLAGTCFSTAVVISKGFCYVLTNCLRETGLVSTPIGRACVLDPVPLPSLSARSRGLCREVRHTVSCVPSPVSPPLGPFLASPPAFQ